MCSCDRGERGQASELLFMPLERNPQSPDVAIVVRTPVSMNEYYITASQLSGVRPTERVLLLLQTKGLENPGRHTGHKDPADAHTND